MIVVAIYIIYIRGVRVKMRKNNPIMGIIYINVQQHSPMFKIGTHFVHLFNILRANPKASRNVKPIKEIIFVSKVYTQSKMI